MEVDDRNFADAERETVYELTDDIVSRISEAKRGCNRIANKSNRLTDAKIATRLGSLLDVKSESESGRIFRYKNYIKKESRVLETIPHDILDGLANIFCEYDNTYTLHWLLTGESTNNKGLELKRPFTIPQNTDAVLLEDLVSVLKKNSAALKALHFAYCELPKRGNTQMSSAINSLIENLSDITVYSLSRKATRERTKVMQELLDADSFSSNLYIKLLKAGDLLSMGERNQALREYFRILQILLQTSPTSPMITDNQLFDIVVTRISTLKDNWTEFPKEVLGLPEKLNEIKNHSLIQTKGENSELSENSYEIMVQNIDIIKKRISSFLA